MTKVVKAWPPYKATKWNFLPKLISFASFNLVYLLFFAIIIILWRNDFLRLLNQIAVFFRRVINEVKRGNNETKLIATLFFSSIFVQFLFSFLGSQPYDSYAQKTWAYISTKYGTDHLYTLSNIVPSGRSVGTFSTINFAYPYPPLLSYIYWFSGLLYSVASPAFDMHTFVLGILMKMPWILATSMLGILIYYFSRKNFSAKVAFILSSLCLFNPCIIFESVIWGQSDSLIASLLILSVFALRKNSIRSMWFFIGLALLTKQTAIIPALFISFFALRKFGLSKSIQNLAFPFTCLFLFLSPFFLMGYSPSFIFNVSVGQNVLNVIGTPQRAAEWQIVASGGAHNLWPILTGALGESGWERFAYPYQHSPLSSVADLTIFVVLIFFILIMMQSILSEKQEINNEKPTFYLLFLAVLTLYTFFTRMQTRYLYLTIPFLIFSFRWIHNRKAFSLLFATLTALFFLSDYSYFTLTGLWQPAFFPNFSPAANPLNLLIFGFVTNDTLITALCSAIFSFFILSMLFSSLRIFNARARNKREKTQSMTLAGDIYRPKYLPKKLWKMAISIHNRLFVDYIQFALKSEVKRNSSVLELGCGKESPIVSLANHLNLSSAVDLYKPSLMYNKKHQYYRHYLLADIRVLPFTPNSFDCIVALDVLEHLCKAEGQRLLVEMEKLSRRKIVILTPNGFSPKLHCEDENVLQHHHSAWISADFTKLGFMVYGINGHKALRGEQAHAVIRPRLIGHLVSKLTERFVYGHPSLAFQLLCIKDKVRMNEPKVHYSSSHNTYGGALPCC
jgi:SAM-dependent methyltransferase